MLSDSAIRNCLGVGLIKIEGGLNPDQVIDIIQPASYELTLGTSIAVPATIDGQWRNFTVDEFELNPGEFMLATTAECVTLNPQIAARLEGKSSLARQGLVVHSTAGFIDPGFSGQITLELSNVGPWPIWLTAGMRIGQLTFEEVHGKVERPYGTESLGSHYQGQTGATPSAN